MLNMHNQQFQHAISTTPLHCRQSANVLVPVGSKTDVAPLLQLIGHLAGQTDTQQGWLLVIAPPQPLTKTMLGKLNINSKRILVIQQHQITRFDHLMRDALTCSTCCAVVSFLPSDHPDLADYQYLSAKYGTVLVNVEGNTQTYATH